MASGPGDGVRMQRWRLASAMRRKKNGPLAESLGQGPVRPRRGRNHGSCRPEAPEASGTSTTFGGILIGFPVLELWPASTAVCLDSAPYLYFILLSCACAKRSGCQPSDLKITKYL
jgi:hypothetical protein